MRNCDDIAFKIRTPIQLDEEECNNSASARSMIKARLEVQKCDDGSVEENPIVVEIVVFVVLSLFTMRQACTDTAAACCTRFCDLCVC